MGAPLVRTLVAAGEEVAVLSRGERAADLPEGVAHLKGDRFDLAPLEKDIAAFAPDVVIDMLAMTAEKDGPVLSFFSGKCRRYVLISSCDVYRSMGRLLGVEPGDVIEGVLDEEGPLREKLYPYRDLMEHTGGGNYDKIPLEEAVLSGHAYEGTVLRLPMVYGPGDRQHRFRDAVAHMAAGRPAILLPEATASWISSWGYVVNVAAAIAKAATHPAAGGEVFNVVDVNDLTQRDWIEALGAVAGWAGEVVTAEADTLPPKRAAMAAGGNWQQKLQIDGGKLERLTGFERPVGFVESLERTLVWEREGLADLKADAFDFAADDAWLAEAR